MIDLELANEIADALAAVETLSREALEIFAREVDAERSADAFGRWQGDLVELIARLDEMKARIVALNEQWNAAIGNQPSRLH